MPKKFNEFSTSCFQRIACTKQSFENYPSNKHILMIKDSNQNQFQRAPFTLIPIFTSLLQISQDCGVAPILPSPFYAFMCNTFTHVIQIHVKGLCCTCCAACSFFHVTVCLRNLPTSVRLTLSHSFYFLNYFLLVYSCFRMLNRFLLYRKVNQQYIHLLFFGFPSHLGHHRALSRFP